MKNEIVFEHGGDELVFNKKMELYYIEWVDAIANTGWMSEGETDDWFKTQSMIVKQVGWIVYEDDECIGMIGRLSEWDGGVKEYGQLQKIPTTWIKKKIKLTKYVK